MKRYKTILFDADNTLLDFLRSERAALTDTLTAMGVRFNEEMLSVYSRINDSAWKRLERGAITKQELRTLRFREFCDCFKLALDATTMADTYLRLLSTKSFLLPGAVDVCQKLAEHCRLYIITNGISSVFHGRFDCTPLFSLFLDTFVSEEIGCEKPAKAYFEAVATRISDFDPATTLVVGDSLTSDVAGGINAGLDTCWLNTTGKEAPADMPITYTVKQLEDVVPLVLNA